MISCTLRLVALAVALALLAGGCVSSEQPLSARADAKADMGLVGTWLGTKEGTSPELQSFVPEEFQISFEGQGIGHLQTLKNGKPDGPPSEFFVTRTDHASFLNVIVSSRGPVYLFIRYRVSEDLKTLQFWWLNRDGFQAAVAAGKLKGKFLLNEDVSGKAEPGKPPKSETRETEIPLNDKAALDKSSFYEVRLQDSPAHLLDFIASAAEKDIFTGPTPFTKVD